MSDPSEILDALRTVADRDRPVPGVEADLARARAAARARRSRRLRAATVASALVAVAGFGVAQSVGSHGHAPSTRPDVALPGAGASPHVQPVQLVDATFHATPYTFDLTPRGWVVQAQNPTAVTIAPADGSAGDDPDVFVGKLVILFDREPTSGTEVQHAGRSYWIGGDSDYTMISTRTRPGEPVGVVRVQYPDNAGWTRASMLAFLASVHVGPGASPGLG
ncbi:MAG TPA: hypothetical protein VFE15_12910 [Marmoricola sp.]|jgi:hypothetical protein|nr:hypothetical protein [Marmoricola sp.]